MKTKTEKLKRFSIFVFFAFCFVISPGLLIYIGIHNNEVSLNENMIQKYTTAINHFFKELRKVADQETFWCNYISEKLMPVVVKKRSRVRENELEKIAIQIQNEAELPYMILNYKKNSIKANFKIRNKTDYIKALKVFYYYLGIHSSYSSFTDDELATVGKVFGPQYSFKQLNDAYNHNGRLMWTDSTGKKPLLYVRCFGKYLIVFFIKQSFLKTRKGLDIKISNFLRNSQIPLNFAYISKSGFEFGENISVNEKKEIINSSRKSIETKKTLIISKHFISLVSFLKPDLKICLFINRIYINNPGSITRLLLLLIYGVVSYLSLGYLWKLIILNKSNFLPIRWLLRILFVFANGLPLVVLFYMGSNFLSQERGNLLEQKLREGTEFLQNFDRNYESMYAKKTLKLKKALKYLKTMLVKTTLDTNIANKFLKLVGEIDTINLIASQSSGIINTVGLIDEKRGIYPPEYNNYKRRNEARSKYKIIKRIGKFFLSMLNKTKISTKDSTEFEVLVESFSQKPLVNFMKFLLEAKGSITQWGFGSNKDPTIMDALYFGLPPKFQYFVLGRWKSEKLQREFLRANIIKANRNSLGIEVVALGKENIRIVFPKSAKPSASLLKFSSKLTTYPSEEVKLVNYKNHEYLVMGFIASKLSRFKLIGLYPVDAINNEISKQKTNLIIFALLSLLITFIISQLLARSFLVPLKHLGVGAKAIEDSNFDHRLPNLGFDEFGRMGKIFNDVMIDLDELSVAGTIQEQLLPQNTIPTGRFSLYGKSVSMSQLGGDYFDYMTVGENSFGLLLGDVAGHGVGASLIMAMAKAGIVQSEALLASPKELTMKLHKLIHASRTKKQRKIMTFQYLYVNQDTGEAMYSNAGACSPILVDHEKQTTEELTLAGPALGAFKRAKYSEIELTINPGNALIFYTDGIVESRNKAGQEIGYDNMKKMFLECWSENAEDYYTKIYDAYLAHLGDEGAQDDLTMVVLVNPGKKNEQA